MKQQLQQQHQQAQYYDPAAAEAVAGFGRASQHGASSYEAAEFGGGGKATRRKGRDMERALARGDLGALGSEVRTKEILVDTLHLQFGSSEQSVATAKKDRGGPAGGTLGPERGYR